MQTLHMSVYTSISEATEGMVAIDLRVEQCKDLACRRICEIDDDMCIIPRYVLRPNLHLPSERQCSIHSEELLSCPKSVKCGRSLSH